MRGGPSRYWAAMTLTAGWLVFRYGLKMPFADEWQWLGQATGREPVTWSWLWAQHNEHRMFLPALIYLGLGRLSGGDFRVGAYFNVAVLSVLSLGMIAVVRRVRGRRAGPTPFFPGPAAVRRIQRFDLGIPTRLRRLGQSLDDRALADFLLSRPAVDRGGRGDDGMSAGRGVVRGLRIGLPAADGRLAAAGGRRAGAAASRPPGAAASYSQV